jgi:hypothetical protein
MRRPRLSIAGLMFAVLWTAVAIAALRTPSRLWAAVLLSAILAALTFSLLGALHARGPSRAFWSGFAISGWLFFAVHYAPWLDEHLGPCLVSTSLCDVAYQLIHPPPLVPMLPTPMPPTLSIPTVTETVAVTAPGTGEPTTVASPPPLVPMPPTLSIPTVTEMVAVTEHSFVSGVPTTVTRMIPQLRVIGGMGASGVSSSSPTLNWWSQLPALQWWSESDTIPGRRVLVSTPPSFSRIANALLCIAFAYLGGVGARGIALTASRVSRSSERSDEQPPEASSQADVSQA